MSRPTEEMAGDGQGGRATAPNGAPKQAPVQILELRSGDLRAALRPDLGGALAGLWFDGRAMLHGREPKAMVEVEQGACFPCVPFAQQLGRSKLRWMDKSYHLKHHTASLHALHGTAWRRPWRVVAVDATSADVRLRHEPDAAWPFAFEARQVFELKGTTLVMQLELTNAHDAPQPAGLGWQFALATGPRVHVEFACRQRWNLDPTTRLPSGTTAVASVVGAIDGLDLDHTFEGWARTMNVRMAEGPGVRLVGSLDRLAVTMRGPDGRRLDGHFRAGPVSHAPDAFHMGSPTTHGLEVLPPGGSLEAWARIEIVR